MKNKPKATEYSRAESTISKCECVLIIMDIIIMTCIVGVGVLTVGFAG